MVGLVHGMSGVCIRACIYNDVHKSCMPIV